MRRVRRGFTLFEMMVVMIILTIVTSLVAPAFARLIQSPTQTTTTVLLDLLHKARQYAILHNATLSLEINPTTGHFRIDTTGVGGTGNVWEDTLKLGATMQVQAAVPRLRYTFFPSGAAWGDTVTIREQDSTRAIFIDKWSGYAFTVPR